LTVRSGSISGSAAGFENRTSPSGPTTITPSLSASKIAARRSRSDDSSPKVSRSAIRIVSSARPRSVSSSRPPRPSSGSSISPSVIRPALRASRFTRTVIAVAIKKPMTMAMTTATIAAVSRSPLIDSIVRASA
jgi:hypothetical protein